MHLPSPGPLLFCTWSPLAIRLSATCQSNILFFAGRRAFHIPDMSHVVIDLKISLYRDLVEKRPDGSKCQITSSFLGPTYDLAVYCTCRPTPRSLSALKGDETRAPIARASRFPPPWWIGLRRWQISEGMPEIVGPCHTKYLSRITQLSRCGL